MPYNPNDPVLGTDMTQGEWDQLRELMRKAEAGGKMNELLTVHKKEVKNAPMNRHYPPDDDDWQESQHKANSSTQVFLQYTSATGVKMRLRVQVLTGG